MNQKTFLISLILVIFIVYFSLSQTAKAQEDKLPNVGIIGDIKSSLLAPKEFQLKNGKGWVLMRPMSEEQISQNNYAEFFRATGLKNIPDARGMFLRGMQYGRDDGKGDYEKRVIGSYQEDNFKKHYHLQGYDDTGIPGKYGREDGGAHAGRYDHSPDPSAQGNSSARTSSSGFDETRPENISVYIYVKVR